MPTTYADVIANVFSDKNQRLGQVVTLGPAANPLSQIYAGREYIGPNPSGVYEKYDTRLDQYTYYTTHV